MSALELNEWIAFYQLEAEDAVPPEDREPQTVEQQLLQKQTRAILAEQRRRWR
jgi:hypothetical protein